jgi:hypothetical protein
LGVDQDLDGNSSGLDLNVLAVAGLSIVVLRCVTVKTSSLKQRCKRILEDARKWEEDYKNSHSGKNRLIFYRLSRSYA